MPPWGIWAFFSGFRIPHLKDYRCNLAFRILLESEAQVRRFPEREMLVSLRLQVNDSFSGHLASEPVAFAAEGEMGFPCDTAG